MRFSWPAWVVRHAEREAKGGKDEEMMEKGWRNRLVKAVV